MSPASIQHPRILEALMPLLDSKKPLVTSGAPRALLAAAALAAFVQAGCGGAFKPPQSSVAAPAGLAYDANPAVYHLGTAVAANAPHSTGGAVAKYTVSPALPPGLVLDAATGVVSGTPSAIAAPASYTVTATNDGGSTTCSLSLTVTDAPPARLVY